MTNHLTPRTRQDLLACVPLCLGFVPEESVVMICLPSGRGPNARIDLPPPQGLPEMCRSLVDPALRHGVDHVVLFVLAELHRGPDVADALLAAFSDAGVGVLDVLGADGRRWRALGPGERHLPAEPYDPLAHPYVAEAVVRGQVVLGSRRQLEAMVCRDEAWSARVAVRLPTVRLTTPGWVRRTVARHAAARTVPDESETAGLVAAVADGACRDAAWGWVEREAARDHVDLWLHVVRASPPGRVAAPAAVLAMLAWLAGDGALAWCALDRHHEEVESCSLAALVVDLLERAVSPHAWRPPVAGVPARRHGYRS